MYTQLYLKWITNKELLYSTGNSTQCRLDGRGIWGRMDTYIDICINMAESLHCSLGTVVTLFINLAEIQPVHSEGDQPWDFFGRNNAKAETPVLWPPHVKSWFIGKDSDAGRDWGQEEKGTTEDEMAGWHHWFNGRESEWTPGVGDGQGGLACCNSWGREESDTTERLNWTELILQYKIKKFLKKVRVKICVSDLIPIYPSLNYCVYCIECQKGDMSYFKKIRH